jgi:3,4-dihydroxy 2-butanone 4-phosphate synthase/GTP cyclohydrolase II
VSYSRVEDAIAAIGRGEFVVVVDDVDRENEGDLIIAAAKVTEEQIAFMVRYTSGLICVPMLRERLDELELPLMVMENTDTMRTAFTVSVDCRFGITTGISAADRAATVRALIGPNTQPSDLARPGHVFPLRYSEGGVLVRAGHTEAAVDLARLAGLYPAGVLCEVVNDDGTMARGQDLIRFAKEHDIVIATIADLVEYLSGSSVQRVAEARLPTEFGDFTAVGFRSRRDGLEQVALVMGDVRGAEDVLVRVHSECLTGDVLGSMRCDCRSQLRESQRIIADEGVGIVLYMRGHEGRGIGLMHKLAAYALQDEGRDTVEANLELGLPVDARDYGMAAEMLRDLQVAGVRLLTNNPAKRHGLSGYGLEVVERVPIVARPNPYNVRYLGTKREKMGHLLDGESFPPDDESAEASPDSPSAVPSPERREAADHGTATPSVADQSG